jgi:cell division septation protein DedD
MATQARILQVASFREPDHAEHLVKELRKKGYRCFRSLPDPSRPGDAYCRVFVGPLPSQESALQMKARLEEEEGYKGILIRSVGKKEAGF